MEVEQYLSLLNGCFLHGASSFPAQQQSVRLFVHSSINIVCLSSFCVGVFYSALPLHESTVALGQSLGFGKKEGFQLRVQGCVTTLLHQAWSAFIGL